MPASANQQLKQIAINIFIYAIGSSTCINKNNKRRESGIICIHVLCYIENVKFSTKVTWRGVSIAPLRALRVSVICETAYIRIAEISTIMKRQLVYRVFCGKARCAQAARRHQASSAQTAHAMYLSDAKAA